MTTYDNEMKGVLFVNDRKEGDQDRDYNGTATINGVELWISGWKKRSKDGKPYLSSFKPKDAPRQQQSNKQTARHDDFGDEIPF